MSATRLHQAKDQGWELIGPAQPSANRSGLRSAFRIEAFNIDIAKRSARCPSGHLSTQCSRLKEAKRQKVSFRFEWSYHCRSCPLRSECVPAGQSHHSIVIGQYHDLLQQRRRDQQTQQFKERMQQGNAIEGSTPAACNPTLPPTSGVVFRAKLTGISEPNQPRHVQNLCRNQLSRFQSICDKGSPGVRLRILYTRRNFLPILWNLPCACPWIFRSI
jgi:hypothetical protein